MNSLSPTKPHNVPSNAQWVEFDRQWTIGTYDEQNRPIGTWQWWSDPLGHLICTATYEIDEQGRSTYHFWRFHPDGTEARRGTCINDMCEGIHYFTRSSHPSTEAFSVMAEPWVWQTETHFRQNRIVEEHYFDKKGQKVQMSYYLDSSGIEEASAAETFDTLLEYLKQYQQKKSWPAMYQVCWNILEKKAFTESQQLFSLFYYICLALYSSHNATREGLPEITETILEPARLALAHQAKPTIQAEKDFIQYVIGMYFFFQKKYPNALLYLYPLAQNIYSQASYPIAIAHSALIASLVHLNFHELAYMHYHYADPSLLVSELTEGISETVSYQNFYQQATHWKQWQAANDDRHLFVRLNDYYNLNVSETDSTDSLHAARQQMQMIIHKRRGTPREIFASLPVDFSYPVAWQDQECILIIEQDLDWQGNWDIASTASYLNDVSTTPIFIVIIQGNLNIKGTLFLSIQESPIPQLIVWGDLKADMVRNYGKIAIHGLLHSNVFITEGEDAFTQADELLSPFIRCRDRAKVPMPVVFPLIIEHTNDPPIPNDYPNFLDLLKTSSNKRLINETWELCLAEHELQAQRFLQKLLLILHAWQQTPTLPHLYEHNARGLPTTLNWEKIYIATKLFGYPLSRRSSFSKSLPVQH